MAQRKRRIGSPLFRTTIDRWREVRNEFEDLRRAAYERALEDCRGALLNARGRKAGINSYDLFIGNEQTALAYASDELIEHWARYPRPVFERYEKQASLIEHEEGY